MGGETAARTRPGITRCAPADLPQAVALLEQVLGPDDPAADPRRAEWLYVRNPHRPGAGCSLWLARTDGRLVGVDGSVPFVLHVDGARYRAQWGIDLAVDPDARGQGIAALLNQALREDADVSCSVGMSDGGYRHALRNGYLDLGTLPVYAHVIHPDVAAAGDHAGARARRLLAGAFALAGRVAARRAAGSHARLVAVGAFGPWSDDVWCSVAPCYRVLASRDASTLVWRYDDGPLRDAYERFRVVRDDTTVGYVVVRKTHWRGAPATSIVDYLAAPEDLAAVFVGVARRARAEGRGAVVCRTLDAAARPALRRAGYVQLPNASRSTRFMVHPTGEPHLDAVLGVPDHWLVTKGDSDQDLDGR